MFGLLKKQVAVNVELKDPSELNAIARVAGFAGEKLDLASQQLRSGFLASEAQGAHIVADHIAFTYASAGDARQPEVVVMTFASPIAWGEDARIDTVIALIIPANADAEALCQQTLTKISAQQASLVATANAGALEKVRRQLL